MRWNAVAGALATLIAATTCLAEMPEFSGGRILPAPLTRGQIFSGQNWWSRYGEAVNADVLAQEPIKSPSDYQGPAPVHGDGYIYGPSSCDCPPPCIWDLWTGYQQHPKRCDGYVPLFHRHCGCGNCGHGKSCGCAAPVPSCTTKVGCDAPVSCTTTAKACGCKPACGKCRHFHFGDKWKCFTAHWHRPCKSCSTPIGCGAPVTCVAPVSCGCATPLFTPDFEKQAVERPPLPLPEDAALLQLPRLN
jgi:hypothetical protein